MTAFAMGIPWSKPCRGVDNAHDVLGEPQVFMLLYDFARRPCNVQHCLSTADGRAWDCLPFLSVKFLMHPSENVHCRNAGKKRLCQHDLTFKAIESVLQFLD